MRITHDEEDTSCRQHGPPPPIPCWEPLSSERTIVVRIVCYVTFQDGSRVYSWVSPAELLPTMASYADIELQDVDKQADEKKQTNGHTAIDIPA